MERISYPTQLSWIVVFHYTIDPWDQPSWQKKWFITQIPLVCVTWLISCSGILDKWSPSYASMTLLVIEGIWYDISRNLTRTIYGMKVTTTRDSTQKLCVYDLATTINWRPVSREATLMLPIELLVLTALFSSGSTLQSRIVTEATVLPGYQFLIIVAWAYS